MKKILLLTASYGTGHVSACKQIQKALDSFYKNDVETKMYDFIKIETFGQSGSIFEKLYNFSMEKPLIWDILFFLSDNTLIKYYFKIGFPLFYRELYKIFDSELPDACVTTHPYWNFVIEGYNSTRIKEDKQKYFTVITDAIKIHHTWITGGCEHYFVADEDTKKSVIKLGVPQEKINVSGFPVNPEFGMQMDSEKFLKELGLGTNTTTLLFVTGLGDTEKFINLIEHFSRRSDLKFQMIVITGKYKRIYDLLISKKYSVPCKIIGWTDKMPDFVRASDLVVAKSGGASVMESLAAGKPLLIPVFSPGQERGNAELIRKNKVGYVTPSFEDSRKVIEYLLKNPQELKELQTRAKQFSQSNAAETIARFVYENAGQ